MTAAVALLCPWLLLWLCYAHGCCCDSAIVVVVGWLLGFWKLADEVDKSWWLAAGIWMLAVGSTGLIRIYAAGSLVSSLE